MNLGRQLRDEIDQLTEPVGVLVVADSTNALIPAAPGGYDPDNADAQEVLDDALALGDMRRVAPPAHVRSWGGSRFRCWPGWPSPEPPIGQGAVPNGAPYGVGYFAGAWQL